MSETMYITGVVIANGIPDSEGDVLTKKDIKTIFTKYLDQSSDVMHDRVKHDGIDVLANWISEVDVEIAGQVAPAGSWLTTLAVTNNEVKTAVNNKELRGLSLGSVSENALTREKWFINKAVNYKRLIEAIEKRAKTYSDLDDIEEVHPMWISLVDKPSNKFGFDVSDYTAFINKRASEESDNMTNENEMQDRISISGWGKITDMFRKADAIDKSESEPVDTEDTGVDKEDSDITNKELLEAIPAAVAEGFKLAMSEMKSDDGEIDKAESESEDDDNADDDSTSINKSESEPAEEPVEEEAETDDDVESEEDDVADDNEDDTAINKRQTQKLDVTDSAPSMSSNQRRGRDHLGRRIKN